jgi:hypothetical protein
VAASNRVRRVVGESVTAALAPTNTRLLQIGASVKDLRQASAQDLAVLLERVEALEGLARTIEMEQRALRQQVDEALDFLRVQHFAVREALELRVSGGTQNLQRNRARE